jgi:hypothetical protein
MAQVNVNPGGSSPPRSSGSSAVVLLALVILVVLLVLAYFVLWPMLSTPPEAPSVNVNVRSSGIVDSLSSLLA